MTVKKRQHVCIHGATEKKRDWVLSAWNGRKFLNGKRQWKRKRQRKLCAPTVQVVVCFMLLACSRETKLNAILFSDCLFVLFDARFGKCFQCGIIVVIVICCCSFLFRSFRLFGCLFLFLCQSCLYFVLGLLNGRFVVSCFVDFLPNQILKSALVQWSVFRFTIWWCAKVLAKRGKEESVCVGCV